MGKFLDKPSGKIIGCPFCGRESDLIQIHAKSGVLFYLCECGTFFYIHEGRIYEGRCSLRPSTLLTS